MSSVPLLKKIKSDCDWQFCYACTYSVIVVDLLNRAVGAGVADAAAAEPKLPAWPPENKQKKRIRVVSR